MLKNPVYKLHLTAKRPFYGSPGDLVAVDTAHPMELVTAGTVWCDVHGYCGTAVLKPATQAAMNYLPPHIRLINRIIGAFGK